jgi:hypothetical protein
VNDLPPLPGGCEDGSDWLSRLGEQGWRMVPSWGHDGWDLLEWPYTAIAHFDGEEQYGLAIYEEGDVTVESFPRREDRDAATDRIAVQYWRANGRGPRDLPDSDGELAPGHLGAFSLERIEREGRP